MTDPERIHIYTDGASRGNPGPAAYGYVIRQNGQEDIEGNGILPDTTNNVAEYTALVKALEHARKLGAEHVVVHSDSELMVRQINGSYRVKSPDLRPLYQRAMALLDGYKTKIVKHVSREENKQTDQLCNDALDKALGKKGNKTGRQKKKPARRADVDEQAIACLQSVAASWAAGNPDSPEPKEVWEQLWSILEEANVLR